MDETEATNQRVIIRDLVKLKGKYPFFRVNIGADFTRSEDKSFLVKIQKYSDGIILHIHENVTLEALRDIMPALHAACEKAQEDVEYERNHPNLFKALRANLL